MRIASASLGSLFLAAALLCPLAASQTTGAPTASLKEIRAEGLKGLPESQVVAFTALQTGAQVSRDDLQAASDRLVATGLFARVRYEYNTRGENLSVVFHVEEAPRVPVYYDNLPWFGDSELADAIRKRLPFFDGTLPEGGSVVDQAALGLNELLAARGMSLTVEHQVIGSPFGEGNVLEFRIEGASLRIQKLEFSDPALTASGAVQQHLGEIVGKPYSRLAIEIFLSEQIRPAYLKQGYLRVKLGPPEVRLTGNPNQKLPGEIPVFVPVATGAIYHWKDVQWSGNNMLSTFTLSQILGLKPGDIADGMAIEAGWDRIREEYGHAGYLEATLAPTASYDEAAHNVSYSVRVTEGTPFKFGEMVVTGLSASAERRLRDAWLAAPGSVLDKTAYENLLTKLQTHPAQVFGDLPVHYEEVGHWLRTDPARGVADILLDFK